jgi:hypothetical protein
VPSSEIMPDFEAGKLHSGSPHGPIVKKKKQAIAIKLSYLRKEGHAIPRRMSRSYHEAKG